MNDTHKDRDGVEDCINNLFNTHRWAAMLERYTHEYEEPTLSEMIEDIAHDVRTRLRSHEEKVRADLIALVEGMKTYKTDFRTDDYGRGMEAGRNYALDDILAALKDTLSASGKRPLSNQP